MYFNFFQKSTYFEVILDRIEVVQEKPGISEWHLKVGKANKTKIITGFVILGFPLGNDIKMETKLMKKQGMIEPRGDCGVKTPSFFEKIFKFERIKFSTPKNSAIPSPPLKF